MPLFFWSYPPTACVAVICIANLVLRLNDVITRQLRLIFTFLDEYSVEDILPSLRFARTQAFHSSPGQTPIAAFAVVGQRGLQKPEERLYAVAVNPSYGAWQASRTRITKSLVSLG
jgi:hypothetical protein